jgi:Ca2+-binding EF-hand superfamily protein/type II secretory pathway pseudopilin PulG
MDSQQQLTNVETVEIEEPSDRVQVLNDEKTCITRKHLYIIVGVLLVAAIALIGTLLGFTAAQNEDDVNQESLQLGVSSTFPVFDNNNDGFIDHNEMSNWMSVQLATCKQNCNGHNGCDKSCGTGTTGGGSGDPNGTVPSTMEVNNMISPCDFDGNGKLSKHEVQACVIQDWLAQGSNTGQADRARSQAWAARSQGQQNKLQEDCPVPEEEGFPGDGGNGKGAACKNKAGLWCFKHFGCQNPKKCAKYYVEEEDTQTQTCCGGGNGVNCTGCTCGSTYTVIPAGGHPKLARWCHKLADFWCDAKDKKINTHCKAH